MLLEILIKMCCSFMNFVIKELDKKKYESLEIIS